MKDYEDSLSELKTIAKRFSKAVRTLGSLNNLEPGLLETWKSKLAKFESDLNVYRREVRRRIADLTSQTNQQQPLSQNLSNTPTVESTGTESHVLSHTQEQLNEFQQKAAREKRKAASKAKCSMSTIKQDLQVLTEEYSVVEAQRGGLEQRWGVAVKKFNGGRYLSLSRGIPVVVPF